MGAGQPVLAEAHMQQALPKIQLLASQTDQRQINDNLVDAFCHGMAQIEQETKEAAEEAYAKAQEKRQREAPRVGRVLLLYVDEGVDDAMPFGEVRKRAFTIMPKEDLL